MSDQTPEQAAAEVLLEAAILACSVALGGKGEILTGWTLVASLSNSDLMDEGSTAYLQLNPSSGQPIHTTIGLARFHLVHLEHDLFEEAE